MEKAEKIKAADVIQFKLKELGRTQKSLAGELGIGEQTFSKKLVDDTLSAREFLAALNALGLTVEFGDCITGDEQKGRKRGVVPRVSMMARGEKYDTFSADALCHKEVFEGLVIELYRDTQGRYFLVLHADWGGVKPAIIPCQESKALSFYQKYRQYDDEENG
jgi:hypothetical protein